MYGKLFASMYDGTLRSNWKALVTLQQLIILCDAEGVIDMTPHALSGRTGIPLDIIDEGIAALEQPDPYSRTKDYEGRRIERLDDHRPWGWVILNYKKYRHLQDAETVKEQNRERQRKRREKISDRDVSRSVTQCHGSSRQAEAEAEADIYVSSSIKTIEEDTSRKNVPFSDILALYHEKLPELPKCVKLTTARKGVIRQRWYEDLPNLDAWSKYFDIVRKSSFLMGRSTPPPGRKVFRADLMWLCKAENICKVIEGKYHG